MKADQLIRFVDWVDGQKAGTVTACRASRHLGIPLPTAVRWLEAMVIARGWDRNTFGADDRPHRAEWRSTKIKALLTSDPMTSKQIGAALQEDARHLGCILLVMHKRGDVQRVKLGLGGRGRPSFGYVAKAA